MASSAQPPPPNPNRPTAPPAVPPLRSIAISKAAEMAMSTDPNRRAALRSHISNTHPDDVDTMLYEVRRRVDEHISRLRLADVLAFDIGGDVEAGLKVVYLLERGSGEEWQAMGRFLRLAFIYRLTPNATRPLRLPAASLLTATAFHQLPLAMAIYNIIGQQLSYYGSSLALQQIDDGAYESYRTGNQSFRVVPLGELPGGHPYAEGYKRADPVIRQGGQLYPSFSAFPLHRLLLYWSHGEGVDDKEVLIRTIGRDNRRYGRLLRTDGITEDQGIVADYRYDRVNLNAADARHDRFVIVSGFRPNETIAAHLVMEDGSIDLYTTEPSAADRSHPLAQRYPVSVGAARRLLRRFGLERDVIDRGAVME
ncbi:unnamed protein product [Vitrella brassicaformis CCMP3155]|uniref:Uncharacterized protein n=1 Tax=Vitrella brassicaformis (strain CCMP3155) TaxID=1169540 RepID=A0A0G4EIW2_VITBC|nr:unnamed protein product [Vitrella brassicaformis CCMP3155]|eukprot:CEL95844.1 unnamed protein product [Vitrella brassicaformis CCMP3155]